MQKNSQSILTAKNINDLLFHLKSKNKLQLLAGCTKNTILNEEILNLRKIPELTAYEKREHYIDFGSAITLNEILEIGRYNIPSILYDAISTIGTYPLRNLATIGGNICPFGQHNTLWAPLLALDAKIEIRSHEETKFIPFIKFTGVPQKHVVTRIRVPLNDWEVAVFRRLGPENTINDLSAGFAFLADTQQNILNNVKIAFSSKKAFRSLELENRLIGSRLPLSDKMIMLSVQEAGNLYDVTMENTDLNPILKVQFLNLLKYSLSQLT